MPAALRTISAKHEYLTTVIRYLENAYVTADSTTAAQAEVEVMAKRYLVDALGAVVTDIDTLAGMIYHFFI